MTDRKKNTDEESKIRKKLEEIEQLINSTHIITERYINPSNKYSSDKVEIYR